MPAVFYVDDSRDDLFHAQYVCRKQQVAVELSCFSTSQAAREILDRLLVEGRALPQLLIVDLYMPLDSGLDLIARLRADDRFARMSFGVCSGSDAQADRDRALAAGADFYLEKPIDMRALISALQ
jgi:CheY-like chemotaxis protein